VSRKERRAKNKENEERHVEEGGKLLAERQRKERKG
jgi:hypothetical protein